MKKWLLFVILIFASLALGSVASAQSSVDAQLLSFVQTAFTNTRAVTSLSVDISATSANMAATATTATPTTQRTSSYQITSDGSGGWNVTGHQTVAPIIASAATPEANATPEATTAATDNNTTLQLVILDGKTYIRYTEIPVRMEVQNPPTNWTDTSTLPPGTTFGGGIPVANGILAVLNLPVDSTGVSALSEQAADIIGGKAMRVFQITLNTQSVLDSKASGVLNVGFGGRPTGLPRTGAPAATPAVGAPAATPQAMTPANTEFTMTVWVGSDNLVYRISSVVTRSQMGAKADTTTTLTTTTDFSNFNQPVTITAPAVGS